jgi:hypothetical protein
MDSSCCSVLIVGEQQYELQKVGQAHAAQSAGTLDAQRLRGKA